MPSEYRRSSSREAHGERERERGERDRERERAERAERERKYLGTHSFIVKGERFVVDAKYVPQKPLGQGAYGVVCSAVDKIRNRKVAIKKIANAFDDLIDAKRILREMKLLRHFSHENIVGLRDLVPPLENRPFDDVYCVMDLMETDLHKIIYSKNDLSDDHLQYFVYQILRGLKYIHSANVIHRDLKPSNLLLNSNCDLKICDFGLARGIDQDGGDLTEYVVTRWYRAPEVMCSCQEYDQKVDVWSVGCILAELHGRKPLFPGTDYIEQMDLIFGVLGTPSAEDMKFITNPKALEYIQSLGSRPPVPLSKVYRNANPKAIDLMEKMLTFDPRKRITVDQALEHPYLAKLHNERNEYDCRHPFNFDFEREELDRPKLQRLMLQEIAHFRPPSSRRPRRSRSGRRADSPSKSHRER